MDASKRDGLRSCNISPASLSSNRSPLFELIDWDLFRHRLVSANIKQNAQRWYVIRAESFLNLCDHDNLDSIVESDVIEFLNNVITNSRLKDWQVLQTIDAIQILCLEVIGGTRFAEINWNDLRLGVKRIEESHATLARESVTGADGKPKFVAP